MKIEIWIAPYLYDGTIVPMAYAAFVGTGSETYGDIRSRNARENAERAAFNGRAVRVVIDAPAEMMIKGDTIEAEAQVVEVTK